MEPWRKQSEDFVISKLRRPLQAALCSFGRANNAKQVENALEMLEQLAEKNTNSPQISAAQKAAWIVCGLCPSAFDFASTPTAPQRFSVELWHAGPGRSVVRELYGFKSCASAVLQSYGRVFDKLRDEVLQKCYFDPSNTEAMLKELTLCLKLEESLSNSSKEEQLTQMSRLLPVQSGLVAEFLCRRFMGVLQEIAGSILAGEIIQSGIQAFLPEGLTEALQILNEIEEKDSLLHLVFQQIKGDFTAFYETGNPIALAEILGKINGSFEFQPYQTYREIAKILRAQRRSGEALVELLTEEEHATRQQAALRLAALTVVQKHIILQPLDEGHVQIGFSPEAEKELEIQTGFYVERELLLQVLEEMKLEAFQRLRVDEAQFLNLLKRKGGRLYDLYVQNYAVSNEKEPLADQQEKEEKEEGEEGEQPELRPPLRLPVPLYLEDDQPELQPQITDPSALLRQSTVRLEKAAATRPLAETAVEPAAYAALIAGAMSSDPQQDTEEDLLSSAYKTPQIPPATEYPEHAAKAFFAPLGTMVRLKEHAVWKHLEQTSGLAAAAAVLQDAWCLGAAARAVSGLRVSDAVLQALLLQPPVRHQLEETHMYLIRLSAVADRFRTLLATLQKGFNGDMDFRHRRLCAGAFYIQALITSRQQGLLLHLRELLAQFQMWCFNDSSQTHFTEKKIVEFRHQFETITNEALAALEPREDRILRGADFYASEAEKYATTVLLGRENNEREAARLALELLKAGARLRLEIEKVWG